MKPVLDPKVFLAALALFAANGCGGDGDDCDSADEQCGDGTTEGGGTSPTAEN